MAKLILENGNTKTVTPENGKSFSLEELQTLVGGYIQIINAGEHIAVLNEEGKFCCRKNNAATDLLRRYIFNGDWIAGDVVIANPEEIE